MPTMRKRNKSFAYLIGGYQKEGGSCSAKWSSGWRIGKFLQNCCPSARAGQRMLFLELGVGYNTPGIIKYPFWRMTARNPKATYACINLGEVGAPPEIEDRSILLSEDIGAALQALREA